jgi:cytochrome c-type biogenesis protein CcmH
LPPVDAPSDYLEQIAQLRAMVPTRPDDLQGWTLLTFHETRLGNYAAAARAQARVNEIKGADAPTEELEREIDLLVAAANGIVSPEAEVIARGILTRDEANVAGRYYIGAIYDQTGRADIALRFWRPIADSGDTSFHGELIRSQIAGTAARAGEDYELPDLRGPGAADIAAAQDMTEEDRTSMIGGMVSQLAGRLATEGGQAADWARLITAYGVLGQTDEARTVYNEAMTTFVGDDVALQYIETAAQSAGISE